MFSDRTENALRAMCLIVGLCGIAFIGWSLWREERYGRERPPVISEPEQCSLCSGTGKCSECNGKATIPCWQCKGKGDEFRSDPGGSGTFKDCNVCQGRQWLKCNRCMNTGKCKLCGGAGKGVVLP